MVMDDWQMLKMVVVNCLTRGSGTYFESTRVRYSVNMVCG